MRLISSDKAKPGDILAQSIFGVDGCLMLREGIALTQKYIDKLVDIGVLYLYIKDANLEDIKGLDPGFLEVKTQAVKSLSKVFSKLQYNDTKGVKDTIGSITSMIEYLLENKEIDSNYLIELKTFDNYTYVHSLNTCVLALFFGIQMSYSKSNLIELGSGAMLHDIGKTRIPLNILNKNGKLTDLEFDTIKKHPLYGYQMLEDVKEISDRAKRIVLEHHERIDGKGYPQALPERKISRFARIVCISDVYDAVVSDRVYRKGFPANEAYEFILGGAGSMFDYDMVNVFRNNFSIFPLGACVKLTNGLECFVIRHNKGFPDRPVVRIVYDEQGNNIVPFEMDLKQKIDVCIESIIV
jgi:HD-GYP domain-containing protein (c-di-GMP phosphodiesterase class II)